MGGKWLCDRGSIEEHQEDDIIMDMSAIIYSLTYARMMTSSSLEALAGARWSLVMGALLGRDAEPGCRVAIRRGSDVSGGTEEVVGP